MALRSLFLSLLDYFSRTFKKNSKKLITIEFYDSHLINKYLFAAGDLDPQFMSKFNFADLEEVLILLALQVV